MATIQIQIHTQIHTQIQKGERGWNWDLRGYSRGTGEKTNRRAARSGIYTLLKTPMPKRFKEYRPIEFHQVCAIARTVLETNPALSDSEWKAATKDACEKQGYDNPETTMLSNALTQVEHALLKTLGPRPVDFQKPKGAEWTPAQRHEGQWKRTASFSGWASLADLIANLQGFVTSEPSSSALPEATARETSPFTEFQVLHRFWAEASQPGADRVAILRTYAEIAIQREDGWNAEQIRQEFEQRKQNRPNIQLLAAGCYACGHTGDRMRKLAEHHIIQVQHGGSNTPRNQIALCESCHGNIHPWLEQKARIAPGWSSLAELAAAAAGEEPKQPRGFTPMRQWRTAKAAMRCGYDWDHRIAIGEWYLTIEVGATLVLNRCRACARQRYGEELPEALAAKPLEEPGA